MKLFVCIALLICAISAQGGRGKAQKKYNKILERKRRKGLEVSAAEIEQLERQFNIAPRNIAVPAAEEKIFEEKVATVLEEVKDEYKKFVKTEKSIISTAGNTARNPDKLQHCFTCSGTLGLSIFAIVKNSVSVDVNSGVEPWLKCIQSGAMLQCNGDENACLTIERRQAGKPYMVQMGCKQVTSCLNSVP